MRIGAILLVPMFLFSIVVAPCLARATDKKIGIEEIKVQKLVGDVTWNGKKLQTGDRLTNQGSIVVGVDEKAMIDLAFISGHTMRLKKGAKLDFEKQESKAEPMSVNLKAGQLFVHFKSAASAEAKESLGEKFVVRTKGAVAGVRGTKFLIQEEDKGTYLCVCEGVVSFRKPSTDGDIRLVNKGEDLWSRPEKPLGQPKSESKMSDMTAAEFKDMGISEAK